jgi:hypothetical protein|tara:strand:- start:465 stop:737 length:273 start_codon:yes stop_codon:yes gene_type:complete
MSRKHRRDVERKRRSGDAEQAMADQVQLFGKLPEQCSACQKSFDKKDRDMVFLWSVVVKQETVRLFCPDCIEKTKEVLKSYEQETQTDTD